ncbi:hypothetical protein HYDPIDRAFT_169105 [Hydnomerulius pinastri MD-312]|uniref:non-specific serine/threonine protein kinase n=1 Tax=Hydnomerulius pinastri MD-312 TaxID=994086 RepID=A0A0C9V9R1_9AGAM|nr:hypothetical protein HYDPIDRAFT_169105 [Hydnomerulius pinastri MD-312]
MSVGVNNPSPFFRKWELSQEQAFEVGNDGLFTTTSQDDPPHFTFTEEPLGLPADEGFGYFQGGPGYCLGPESRFKIEAKLGFGTTSSMWLARDQQKDHYVAIKILTGCATQLNREDKLQELKVLQYLSPESASPTSTDTSRSYTKLLSHFYHQGIETDGEHLCLVMELLGSDIHQIRSRLPDNGYLPLPIVKRMLRQVLLGIAHAHARGIAHTDIKPDNILVALSQHWSPRALTEWLKDNPPQAYPPERSLTKMVTAFVTQSFPDPTVDELALGTFKLADWGSAQFVDRQTTDDITPLGLRPPEIILGGEWDESVDIWTYGCIAFNAITNRPLFKAVGHEEKNATDEDILLYQMIIFCGEFFQADFLMRCSRSHEYFNRNCKPKKFDRFVRKPFQECIRACNFPFSDDGVEQAAAFLTRCLRLDPKNRATASELLQDPWPNSLA